MNLLCLSFAGLAMATVAVADDPPPSTYTTVTVSVTVTPTVASTAPQFTDAALFTEAVLNSTNFFRDGFNASWVAWNDTIADFASSYLASMGDPAAAPGDGSECEWAHSGGPYGENIALGCSSVTDCIDLCAASFFLFFFSFFSSVFFF